MENGLSTSLPRVTTEAELQTALHYGTHVSAGKEVDFVHHRIAEQAQSGHVVVFNLPVIRGLPKWWLYPVAKIPQLSRLPCLIFDLTWSSLNKATARKASKEVIWFRGTLHRIMRRVVTADPRLGPV